ncbi:glycosyltransferase BC10-like isoform X2 [Macadamia integrifolia]|uniref:glycosyltransferase BC10-like isoform X2 n=1 Tax=Macadamia integrifolia TaxID=60698 RepID=UPI001C4E6A1D|nr:glycosyltransferase BC10-like isoform X2 [Macadamia integrifolia]
MRNEKPEQSFYFSKCLNTHLQLNRVIHGLFFVIGLSLGIIGSFYLKSFLFIPQASLTHISTSFPVPPPPPPPPSPPPPPPPPTPTPPPPPPPPTPTPPPPPPPSPSLPPPPPPPPPPPALSKEIPRGSVVKAREENKFQLMHNMDDQELFAKARLGRIDEVIPHHQQKQPKVAFMFLTTGPLPLAPLWEMFFRGYDGLYSIYVHPDPSFNGSVVPENSIFYRRRIPSQKAEWGMMTMIDAERRLLASALLDDPSNQRFVKAGRGRYNRQMFPVVSISDWRKGSQWFEVHRDIAIKIISDQKYYPVFRNYCQPSCYNDEHYIPTLINIISPELNSNRSITWVDWSRPSPHPRKFGWRLITEELLNYVRFGSNCTYNGNTTSICFLFARKFAADTLRPLLKIAPSLLGFDS